MGPIPRVNMIYGMATQSLECGAPGFRRCGLGILKPFEARDRASFWGWQLSLAETRLVEITSEILPHTLKKEGWGLSLVALKASKQNLVNSPRPPRKVRCTDGPPISICIHVYTY